MATDRRASRSRGGNGHTDAAPVWPPKELAEEAAPVPHWNGGPIEPELVDAGIERLRADAVRIARADAASGVPAVDRHDPPESEFDLKERCHAFVQRVRDATRRRAVEEAGELEESVTARLAHASLKVDRFERLTNDLTRLRVRRDGRKREVTEELTSERSHRGRGISTKVYIVAIAFLGLVEFLANAPVFSSLLPRDPLTERQIRILSETSDGWFAGAEQIGRAHV